MRRFFVVLSSPVHLLLAAVLLGMTGCVPYRIQVKSYQKLDDYHRVYVDYIKNDRMFMQGRISARLKLAGFDAVDINPDGPPLESQGSGFVIDSRGDILTCAHVVYGRNEATAWIQGKRYVGHVAAQDTNVDAAIIQLDGEHPSFQPLPLIQGHEYHMGQDVYTMGFPLAEILGNSPRLTKGLISATVGIEDNPDMVQLSAEVQPGNSGGPLLDDKGEAIGLVRSTLNPIRVLTMTGNNLPQNVNFAVKTKPLREFLGRSKIDFTLETNVAVSSSLDNAKDSIALIRSGIVEDKDIHAPSLYCRCRYMMPGDDVTRLKGIILDFVDTRTAKNVLVVTGIDNNFLASHGEMLDQMFAQIYAASFPDRPNPFTKR